MVDHAVTSALEVVVDLRKCGYRQSAWPRCSVCLRILLRAIAQGLRICIVPPCLIALGDSEHRRAIDIGVFETDADELREIAISEPGHPRALVENAGSGVADPDAEGLDAIALEIEAGLKLAPAFLTLCLS